MCDIASEMVCPVRGTTGEVRTVCCEVCRFAKQFRSGIFQDVWMASDV